MSFARPPGRRGPSAAAPTRGAPQALLRVVLLAAAGVLVAGWGLWHHYTQELPPMRVPRSAPRAVPSYDSDAGEIPAPEIEEDPHG